MLLEQTYLQLLLGKKNLLAFSGGVDSTALFFLLLEKGINFDIAIVDYNLRKQSKEEVGFAKELAKKYNKQLFLKETSLPSSNFEANARKVRYDFFNTIIKEYSYQNLLTAHQLDDKLEWFFMQLARGAGIVELLGFEEIEKRDNYFIIKPLLNTTKDELLNYLHKKDIKYFIDHTNKDTKYKRNYIRENYTKEFLKEYKNGIKKSFTYLQQDKKELLKIEILFNEKDFYILKKQDSDAKNIRAIDKIVKKLGLLMSKNTKDELLRQKDIVLSNKISVSITNDKIYISPFVTSVIPKKFKELCRVKKIPPKVRSYLFKSKVKNF